jgi:hypothetical protein
VIALHEPVSLTRVDNEFVSSSPCTISTGVRNFDANEMGLTWSWGCGRCPPSRNCR